MEPHRPQELRFRGLRGAVAALGLLVSACAADPMLSPTLYTFRAGAIGPPVMLSKTPGPDGRPIAFVVGTGSSHRLVGNVMVRTTLKSRKDPATELGEWVRPGDRVVRVLGLRFVGQHGMGGDHRGAWMEVRAEGLP